MDTVEHATKEELLILMASALQRNGIPAHRMESSFLKLCGHLKVTGDIFTSPGGVILNIGNGTSKQTHFVKVAYGDLNMEALNKIDIIYRWIIEGKMSVTEAISELKSLDGAKPRYGTLLQTLFLSVSTASAARVFGGGVAEILVSAIIGLFIGFLIIAARYYPQIGNMLIALSSVFAIAISKLATIWLGNYSVETAAITGLILLIPGFSFTVSITELVNGHPIAGTARFANTIITLLMIGLGIAIGSQVDRILPEKGNLLFDAQLPAWTLFIALITVPLGFVVLFNAVMKDFIWILCACWCSYFSIKFASDFLSPQLAVFIASCTLGVASNVFSMIKNRPATIMLVPGIILLVPGSLGFKSIYSLIDNQTLSGIEAAFSMTFSSIALVSGLVFSNAIVPLKRAL